METRPGRALTSEDYAEYGKGAQYQFYKEEGGELAYKEWYNIHKDFASGLAKLIVQKNHIFEMPSSLGQLRIQEVELRSTIKDGKLEHNRKVNMMETFRLWKRDPAAKEKKKYIYYHNDHTGGKMYKFKWDKRSQQGNNIIAYGNRWAYYFRPLHTMRKVLVEHLRDPLTKNEFYQ